MRVEDVRLSSIPGAVSPEMVRLPEARISVAFAPLLEGRLATVVTLVRPTINLEKLQDGRVNWNFATNQAPAATSSPASGSTSSGVPFDVKLDSFRIVNGSVGYYDAGSGTVERVEALNSEVSFDSLSGPFRIDGKATIRGIPVAVKASTGMVRANAPLAVIADVSTADGASTARLNGTVTGLGDNPAIKGEIEANSDSVAGFIESVFHVNAPRVLAQPLKIHGNLAGSPKSLSVSAVEIQLGEARANGDFNAEFGDRPRVTGVVKAGNLNLDALLDGAKGGAEAPASAVAAKTGSGTTANPAVEPQVKDESGQTFALPANLDASIEMAAEIIQYNGALVRDLSVKMAIKDGRGVIEDISAVLPGNSSFDVKGGIAAVDGQPDLNLQISGSSDNLREMIEWLGVDVASVPPDRLRRFSVAAAVTGSPKNLTAKDIRITLDTSTVSGGLALVFRDRPAFGLRLVVDRVNLDGYLPGRDSPIQSTSAPSPSGAPSATQKAVQPKSPDGVLQALHILDSFDANIEATIKNLIVARTPATDLSVDLTVLNGNLEVRHAGIGDLAGMKGTVKGKLDRAKDQPSVDADYTVEITDTARFARFTGNPALMNIKARGRLASSGKIAGNLDQVGVKSRLEALGVTVDVDGALTTPLSAPTFKLATSIKAPELVQLVRLAAEDYSPAAGKLGPVDLSFQLEGSANQVRANSVTGHLGPVALHGSGDITLGDVRPKLHAAFSTSEISLDLFLPPEGSRRSEAPMEYRIVPAAATQAPASTAPRWSSDPIDTGFLDAMDADIDLDMAVLAKDHFRFKDSKLKLRLDAGKLTLDPFSANFSTGTIKVTGALAAAEKKLSGTVNLALNGVDASDLAEALRNYQVRLGPVQFGAKMTGPVTVTADLGTLGGSARDLASGLNGNVRIAGQLRTDMSGDTRQASAIAGLAGALLGSKVKEIRGVTNSVQGTDLLVSAFEGPATLNGDISVDHGIFTTRNLVLVARGGRALTAGTASLPAWKLDSITDVTLGQDTDPYLTVQVTGALDDPYVRKVSGTLLRGMPVSTQSAPSAGQSQQDAPGGGTAKIVTPPNSAQSAPAKQKVKPEDVLKGLLQGLSR